MYVNPDPSLNEALVEALEASARVMSDRVYFDWDNDNFHSEYSDMSKVVVSCQLERSTLTTDLPEAVNTIQGYSSAELTLVLRGNRTSEEDDVVRLLSAFNVGGPFFNRDLTGTTVRYDKRVETVLGNVDIRQFTGVVRDIQLSRKTGEVRLICSDIMQWANNNATLWRWAVDSFKTNDYKAQADRPINASWVVGELLRQAGTPVGPLERTDCIASCSAMGACLPSVGLINHYDGALGTDDHVLPTVSSSNLLGPGKYGPAFRSTEGSGSSRTFAGNVWRMTRRVYVPQTGTSEGPVNVGFTRWAYSDGSANRGLPAAADYIYFDGSVQSMELWDGITNVIVQVAKNGQVYVTVSDDTGSMRVGWNNVSTGWHHFDVNVQFRNNAIQVVLTIDGVNAGAPTYGSFWTRGFHWITGSVPPVGRGQRTGIQIFDPAQHFQIYYNGGTPTFQASEMDPPVTKDGLPWVQFGGCHAELSWIPDVYKENIWETLQKLATAEFAAMYTNEWGQLVWRPHFDLRNGTPLVATASYTVDSIVDLVTNPSLDQYKNVIEMAYTDRAQEPADLWSPASGIELYMPKNATTTSEEYRIDDMVKMVRAFTRLIGWSQIPSGQLDRDGNPIMETNPGATGGDEYDEMWYSRSSAVPLNFATFDAEDPNHDGVSENYMSWYTEAIPSDDQRGFRIMSQVNNFTSGFPWSGSPGLLMGGKVVESTGSGPSAQPSPNMYLRGKKIGEQRVRWWTEEDATGIAQNGRFVLRLEPTAWRQTSATAQAIAPQLLSDTKVPAPVINGLRIPCDPRLQITDYVELQPTEEFSGPITAQVVGIIRDAKSGEDSLDLRITRTPSKWALGIPLASELGVTTVLN